MSLRLRTGCCAAIALAAVTACPRAARAQSETSEDAVVVFAVKAACRVLINEGEIDGSQWRTTAPMAVAWARSERDFVVLTLKPRAGNKAYAVGTVFAEDASGKNYFSSGGGPMVVFHASPGQVTYAGTLHLVPQGNLAAIAVDEEVRREQLYAFLKSEHPELALPLRFEAMQTLDPSTGGGAGAEPSAPAAFGRVLTGMTFGVSGGFSALRAEAAQRVSAGSGFALVFALGVALWDHVPINFSVSRLILDDRQPITETVVECTMHYGAILGCDNPHQESSDVRSGVMLALETGYQHRFTFVRSAAWPVSLVPALIVGHVWTPTGFTRGVACDGCASIPIEGADVAGYYLGPAVKLTFGKWLALTARVEHYLSGDMADRFLFGGELGRL
jgi:hypothetical protein